ncbi:MFS amine transporter [Apiospora arundinis]|uniref:MFS amine transporter n=1 Tax=Apiospora arundinis TaxID=335852 RepID=A0ABR2HKE8_9PEZI
MPDQPLKNLPWHLRLRSSNAFVITAVAIAIFTDTFLYGQLIPVFPDVIRERCSIPQEKVQLFTSVAVGLSGLGNLVGAFAFGYMADHVRNRRTSLLLGLAVFIGGTAMVWAARHITIMCIGRLLQGLASAAVWSVGLALLVDTVGKSEVPVAMGYVNIGFSCGTVAGPIVGGVTYSIGGFNTTMGLAVGLLGLDVALRLLIIEKKDLLAPTEALVTQADDTDSTDSGPDATTPLLREQRTSATEAREEAAVGGEVTTEFAFETLVKSRRLLVNLTCALVQAVTMSAFEATLPIHLQETSGFDTLITALVFIPLMVPAFFSPIIGVLCERLGNRPIAATGYIICGVMLVLLRFHDRHDTLHEVAGAVDLSFIGVAMCMIMTPVLSDIFGSVEELEEETPGRFGLYGAFAQAYGLFEFSYSAGVLIGPLLAAWLKTQFAWSGLTLVLGIINITTISVIYMFKAVNHLASGVVAALSSILPTLAILVLYYMHDMVQRIGLLIVFTTLFAVALAVLTDAKQVEVFSATAAFAVIEVVFIGSTNGASS